MEEFIQIKTNNLSAEFNFQFLNDSLDSYLEEGENEGLGISTTQSLNTVPIFSTTPSSTTIPSFIHNISSNIQGAPRRVIPTSTMGNMSEHLAILDDNSSFLNYRQNLDNLQEVPETSDLITNISTLSIIPPTPELSRASNIGISNLNYESSTYTMPSAISSTLTNVSSFSVIPPTPELSRASNIGFRNFNVDHSTSTMPSAISTTLPNVSSFSVIPPTPELSRASM